LARLISCYRWSLTAKALAANSTAFLTPLLKLISYRHRGLISSSNQSRYRIISRDTLYCNGSH